MNKAKLIIGLGAMAVLVGADYFNKANRPDNTSEEIDEVVRFSPSGNLRFIRFYTKGNRKLVGKFTARYDAKAVIINNQCTIKFFDESGLPVDLPVPMVETIAKEFGFPGTASYSQSGVGSYEISPA